MLPALFLIKGKTIIVYEILEKKNLGKILKAMCVACVISYKRDDHYKQRAEQASQDGAKISMEGTSWAAFPPLSSPSLSSANLPFLTFPLRFPASPCFSPALFLFSYFFPALSSLFSFYFFFFPVLSSSFSLLSLLFFLFFPISSLLLLLSPSFPVSHSFILSFPVP